MCRPGVKPCHHNDSLDIDKNCNLTVEEEKASRLHSLLSNKDAQAHVTSEIKIFKEEEIKEQALYFHLRVLQHLRDLFSTNMVTYFVWQLCLIEAFLSSFISLDSIG